MGQPGTKKTTCQTNSITQDVVTGSVPPSGGGRHFRLHVMSTCMSVQQPLNSGGMSPTKKIEIGCHLFEPQKSVLHVITDSQIGKARQEHDLVQRSHFTAQILGLHLSDLGKCYKVGGVILWYPSGHVSESCFKSERYIVGLAIETLSYQPFRISPPLPGSSVLGSTSLRHFGNM